MVKMVVCLAIVLASSVAYAQPAPPATLDEWVGELVSKPADAEKRFEFCQAVILASGELRAPCKLSVKDLAGTDKDVVLKATKVKTKKFPKSMLLWNEADVEVRVAKKLVNTFHVYELATYEIGMGDIILQYWAKLVPDKAAIAQAQAGTLKSPTITAGRQPDGKNLSDQDKSDRANALDTIEQFATDSGDIKASLAAWAENGATIIGSASGQRFTGKAGAKTLKAWKMDLKLEGKPASGGTPMVQWAYTKAVATTKDKTPVTIPYNVLYVSITRMTGGGSPAPFQALVIFSVPQ